MEDQKLVRIRNWIYIILWVNIIINMAGLLLTEQHQTTQGVSISEIRDTLQSDKWSTGILADVKTVFSEESQMQLSKGFTFRDFEKLQLNLDDDFDVYSNGKMATVAHIREILGITAEDTD